MKNQYSDITIVFHFLGMSRFHTSTSTRFEKSFHQTKLTLNSYLVNSAINTLLLFFLSSFCNCSHIHTHLPKPLTNNAKDISLIFFFYLWRGRFFIAKSLIHVSQPNSLRNDFLFPPSCGKPSSNKNRKKKKEEEKSKGKKSWKPYVQQL